MKGYIYEIVSPNFEKRYIGCCIQNGRGRDTLKERFHHHKGKHNSTASRFVIEMGEAEIKMIECVEIDNIRELRQIEREYISTNYTNLVNLMGKYKSNEEYKKAYQDEHKEDKKIYDIEYRKKRDKIKIECECGGTYLIKHKSTHLKTKKHQQSI